MSQEQMTIYQSNLVVFDEVKYALNNVCDEECSGVFFMTDDNGDGAGFRLDQGKIVDAGYKTMRGNKALSTIKNIERARFFFERGESVLPEVSHTERDLPDTASILSFLGVGGTRKATASETAATKRKIMVVDDSRMVRSVVNKILSKENYEVIQIEDGEQALPAIDKERPELVLLDIVLPGIDGNEVLRRIRETEFGKELLVVILTSNDSLVEEGSTASGQLPKPFKPKDLLHELDGYFSSSELNAA